MYGNFKKPRFALVAILFGSFAALLGLGIICGGGFNSVMQDPKGGPYNAVTGGTVTAGVVSGATVNPDIVRNNGHFLGLLKQYPELFNWSDFEDLVSEETNAGVVASNLNLASGARRDASTAYTKRHAGENSWIFALYFPFALTLVILGFIAFFRKSGYTLSLVGLALSAFMISFTLLIVIHYQAKSFVPQALDAFTDCDDITTTVARTELVGGVQFGSVNGPAPRRPWLCKSEFSYDNDLRTAANLVYGGAATSFVGYIALVIGFAYLVQPFVVPTPNFAKAPLASSSYRGADVDFDDYSEDYSEDYSDE